MNDKAGNTAKTLNSLLSILSLLQTSHINLQYSTPKALFHILHQEMCAVSTNKPCTLFQTTQNLRTELSATLNKTICNSYLLGKGNQSSPMESHLGISTTFQGNSHAQE